MSVAIYEEAQRAKGYFFDFVCEEKPLLYGQYFFANLNYQKGHSNMTLQQGQK